MGKGKLYFPVLKSVKRQKGPLFRTVSQLILSPVVAGYQAFHLSSERLLTRVNRMDCLLRSGCKGGYHIESLVAG